MVSKPSEGSTSPSSLASAFAPLGPDGAGKSTPIGMLTTTIVPTGGLAKLAWFDAVREPLAAASQQRRVRGTVVDRRLSGWAHLDMHARLWSVDSGAARRRGSELIEAFGLGDMIDRPVPGYSGGKCRGLETPQAGLARALVSEPQALFLDDLTVGLDTRIRHELLDLIGGLRLRNDMSTLLTTPLSRRGQATVRPDRRRASRDDRRDGYAREAARSAR